MIKHLSIFLLAALVLMAAQVVDDKQEKKKKRYLGEFSLEEILDHSERYKNLVFLYEPAAEYAR